MWFLKLLSIILVPALIPAILGQIKFGAKKVGEFAKRICFNASLEVFCLLVLEVVIGRKDYTLLYDFEHLSIKNVWFYSIAFLIISILISLIMRLFRELNNCIIDNFLCVFAVILLPSLIFFKLSNLSLLIIIGASLVIGFLISVIIKKPIDDVITLKGNVAVDGGITLNSNQVLLAVVTFLYSFMMKLFLPNELYLSNYQEIPIHSGIYLSQTIISFLLFWGLCYLCLYFLPNRLSVVFGNAIFILSVACYVQGNFLNGYMQSMDGSSQTWDIKATIINILCWIVLVSIILLIEYLLSKKIDAKKVIIGVSIYLVLVQLVSLVFMELTIPKEQKYLMTVDNQLTLDDENNVIVFVLDWFDTQIIDGIEENNKEFLKSFKDFTYYDNCSGLYFFTAMGIPYLITGVKCPEKTYMECGKYCFNNSELVADILNNNYSMSIYTEAEFLPKEMLGKIDNYKELSLKDKVDIEQLMDVTYRSSQYRCYPYVIKSPYFYSNYDFNAVGATDKAYDTSSDKAFAWDVVSKEIEINEDFGGAYRLYHLTATHPPFQKPSDVSDDAVIYMGKESLQIVFNYIENLKKAGLYDQASIIVTADHGQNFLLSDAQFEQTGFKQKTSNPICFLKLPNQNNDDMKISHVAVTQSEIVQTIAESAGLNKNYTGTKSLADTNDGDYSERFAYFYQPGTNNSEDVWFRIGDNVKDWNDWSIVKK